MNFEQWLGINKGYSLEECQENRFDIGSLEQEFQDEVEEMDLEEIIRLNSLPKDERDKDLH